MDNQSKEDIIILDEIEPEYDYVYNESDYKSDFYANIDYSKIPADLDGFAAGSMDELIMYAQNFSLLRIMANMGGLSYSN